MRIDRDPALIAYQAADETRALNVAMRKPAAFPDIDAVRAVTEGLQLTVHQLPTAVQQLAAGLRALEEQGVHTANDAGAAGGASRALRALLNAEQSLTVARQELRAAEAALTSMASPASVEVRTWPL